MTTKLGQLGYRRFDYQGRGSRAAGSQLKPNVVWIRGPWPGWEPDLNPTQATPGAAFDTAAMIDREGTLTHQNGFEKVASATLPLGDTSPPASATDAEPVVCIAQGRTASTQAIRRYAITSDTAAASRGHFYELVAGVWTERPFNNTSGGNAFTGDTSDRASTLCDNAHYSAADYTVFSSGQANNLLRFPGLTVAAEYEQLAGLGALATLAATSVLSSEERLHAFGTVENGTVFPARWRWTSKGANGQFDPSLTGTGYADLNELGGEGLAVRNLGPKIALYTTSGVLLASRTGQTTDPFRKDYATYERGLLSTKSVVTIASGVHFGLFTDGWFFFRYDGVWEEKGITQGGYHKWRREFYGTLDWANRKRIVCEFDENDGWVYIAFPQSGVAGNGPSTVWIYDVNRDTCWPAPNWTYKPNIFGSITEEAAVGLTWGDFTTTPWSSGAGSWGSYESETGQRRILHGTDAGLVYVHLPSLVTQDGVLPNYRYQSHWFGGEQPEVHKKIDGLYLGYTRVQNSDATDPSPVTLAIQGDQGTQNVGSVTQTKGTSNTQQTDFTNPGAITALQHRFTLSGTAPIKASAVGVQITGEPGKVRKEGAI